MNWSGAGGDGGSDAWRGTNGKSWVGRGRVSGARVAGARVTTETRVRGERASGERFVVGSYCIWEGRPVVVG